MVAKVMFLIAESSIIDFLEIFTSFLLLLKFRTTRQTKTEYIHILFKAWHNTGTFFSQLITGKIGTTRTRCWWHCAASTRQVILSLNISSLHLSILHKLSFSRSLCKPQRASHNILPTEVSLFSSKQT